jgi:hypothetical protein
LAWTVVVDSGSDIEPMVSSLGNIVRGSARSDVQSTALGVVYPAGVDRRDVIVEVSLRYRRIIVIHY